MKTYCPTCGQPSEYRDAKPNFCQSCGSSFVKTAKASKPSRREIAAAIEDDVDLDDDTDEIELTGSLPDIESLAIELDDNPRHNRTTVGSMSTLPPVSLAGERPRPQVSNEELLKQMAQEAGSKTK